MPLSNYAPEGLCAACLLESAFEEQGAVAGGSSRSTPLLSFNDYELLEEIARGGMGVVYRARQISLNRVLAVKMILTGHLANAVEMQRFRAEAETAAQLQHPNIVAIHEVGEHAGQPFFSMDLVEGQNLARLVRDEPLPTRKAAGYLKTIAEAVQYAHSRGVLHRDLKPSNILIDDSDQPRITDFGLAKRLTSDSQPSTLNPQLSFDPHLTQTGQVLGSPSFIPPEQAAGQKDAIGPASDVYSLGAILYQCLTARPPFVAETITATLRMVAETEPVSPRLLNASVPRDLETICLKCLQKEPQRRYKTAQDLADDLGCYLRDEPIHAQPIGPTARLWRWCRRNRALASAGGAAITLLLVVAVGSPIAAFRINSARQQAEADKKKAQTEATKSRQVAQFLKDMLKGLDPSLSLGRDTVLLREILDKTAERVGPDLKNHPEVEAELRSTIGSTYFELGDYAKAEAMQREALRLRRTIFGPTNEYVAASLNDLANVRGERGDRTQAETMLREALAMRESLLGNEHPDVAASLVSLATVLFASGKVVESEARYREALAILEKLPTNTDVYIAGLLMDLGVALVAQGKLAEAEETCRKGWVLSKKSLGEGNLLLANAAIRLGNVLEQRRKLGEAETLCLEAVAMRRKLLGNEHPYVASALDRLASGLILQGKLSEAETAIREAVAIRRKLWGPVLPTGAAGSLSYFAETLAGNGKLAEAEAVFREALQCQRTGAPTDKAGLSKTLAGLTATLLDAKKFTEAESFARECLDLREKTMPNEWRTFYTRSLLGGSLLGQKKYADAEPFLVSGYEGLKQRQNRIPDWAQSLLRDALQRLVQLYEATSQADKAADWKRKLTEFNTAEAAKRALAP